VPFGVLLPWSRFLLVWDLICSTMLLVMSFYLPLRLSYFSERDALQWPEDAWLAAIDLVYMLDMLVGMSTAHYDYLGNLETRRWLVVRHYLRGWFPLDMITCFPSDWLYLGVAAANGTAPNAHVLLMLRALRLGRALRLLTHRRVFTYLSHVFSRLKIRAAYVTILKRTIVTIIFAHCNACLQFLISVLEGLPEDCWVVRAEIVEDVSVTTQYLASVFHAVSQMLAVGYGVVLPRRDSEYVTFVISLVLGANLYAVFVGTLISVIEDANGSHREYCKRIDMLQTWMCQRQLPRQLRHKLETYFEILFPGGHAFDDDEILSSLSAPLYEEVARHKCSHLLRQLEIDWRNTPGLARRLSLSITRQVFVDGDIIVHEGQAAHGMYFIVAGRVGIYMRARGVEPVKELSSNDGVNSLFGEMSLLNPTGRAVATVSVPAHAYCDTFLLPRERFQEVILSYPSFRRRIEGVKKEREHENAKANAKPTFDGLSQRIEQWCSPAASPAMTRLGAALDHAARTGAVTASPQMSRASPKMARPGSAPALAPAMEAGALRRESGARSTLSHGPCFA